jgi:type II secretory pathway pseudopilin PulG
MASPEEKVQPKTLSAGDKAGEAMKRLSPRAAGTTLLEAVVATALVALALAVAYPSVSEGVEAARLRAAADEARMLLLDAQHFADRHRQAVLLRIDPSLSRLDSLSEDGQWDSVLMIPAPLRIVVPAEAMEAILHPGGALPEVHLALASSRGARAGFRVDSFRGTLQGWRGCE